MPSLVANYKEKQTVTAVKKFYSVLSQAIKMYQFENPENYNIESAISSLFNVAKICEPGDMSCAPMEYKSFGRDTQIAFGLHDPFGTYYYAQLADGMIIRYRTLSEDCSRVQGTSKALQNYCGEFAVDINGNKSPNRVGHDVFYFIITKYGVLPHGVNEVLPTTNKFDSSCKKNADGYGCTAWIITHGNMEYLHCDDLTLNGKSTCK